jgi:hypothetical protein
MGGQHHAPAALPPEKTRYPLYRRLGGHQGRSGRVRKTSLPPGFDPRIFHPVICGNMVLQNTPIIYIHPVYPSVKRRCFRGVFNSSNGCNIFMTHSLRRCFTSTLFVQLHTFHTHAARCAHLRSSCSLSQIPNKSPLLPFTYRQQQHLQYRL